jgi:hypothetical protein
VKAGKWGISKSMPKLEASIESSSKPYIQANIERIIDMSKEFLERELDAQNLKHIANDKWKELRIKKLSSLSRGRDAASVDEFVDMLARLWEDIRQRESAHDICSAIAGLWLERYGDQPIIPLLNAIGIGKDDIITQIQAYAPTIVRQATQSGLLEERIRAQLAPFYASAKVRKILAG